MLVRHVNRTKLRGLIHVVLKLPAQSCAASFLLLMGQKVYVYANFPSLKMKRKSYVCNFSQMKWGKKLFPIHIILLKMSGMIRSDKI